MRLLPPWPAAAALWLLLALASRCWGLGQPHSVVWDEAHFGTQALPSCRAACRRTTSLGHGPVLLTLSLTHCCVVLSLLRGKFANHYLTGTFYHDVHPPAAKLMLSWAGRLAGYNGSFAFESGGQYPADMPIGAMRLMPALFGAAVVPLVYLTLCGLHASAFAAHFAALCVLLDPGLIAISRYLLLDPFLLCFIAATTASLAWWLRIYAQLLDDVASAHSAGVPAGVSHVMRSKTWWACLHLLGWSLGMCISVKWTGFFTALFAALVVAAFFLHRATDARHSLCALLTEAGVVALTVGGWLVLTYLLWFALHFQALPSGSDDLADADSMFVAQWDTGLLEHQSALVTTGSLVSLKNNGGSSEGGGFLHSHADRYPAHPHSAPDAQQVTVYGADDDPNNEWRVWPAAPQHDNGGQGACFITDTRSHLQSLMSPLASSDSHLQVNCSSAVATSALCGARSPCAQYLFDGAHIRLQHVATQTFLAARDVPAPLSEGGLEVSAAADGEGDSNATMWQLRLISAPHRLRSSGSLFGSDSRLHILTDRFTLRSVQHNCTLRCPGVQLPDWAFSQKEVFCDLLQRMDANALWNVHEHEAPEAAAHLQPPRATGSTQLFWRYSFLDAVWSLNRMMLHTNRALSPQLNKPEHTPASPPNWWPLLKQGIRMTQWSDEQPRVYMFGNVLIWWAGAACAVLAPVVCAVINFCALRHRGGRVRVAVGGTSQQPEPERWRWPAFWFVWAAYVCHYAPMFIVGRVTYLHHYYPSALFLGALIATALDAWASPSQPDSPRRKGELVTAAGRHSEHELVFAYGWRSAACVCVALGGWALFGRFAYPMHGPVEQLQWLQWTARWHFA